jgi:hypothetical protein
MQKNSKLFTSAILVSLLIFTLACSLSPANLKTKLFKPTATNTSTSTPIPTKTLLPTKTPVSPLSLKGCVYQEDCPSAIDLSELLTSDPRTDSEMTVHFSLDKSAWLVTGWIAKDEATLTENLKHIHWIFEVDGQDYFNSGWEESGVVPDQENSSISYPGKWFGVEMTGWKVGESHQVRIGYQFTEGFNDGWQDHPAGYSEIFTYNVFADAAPTATPTPRATATLKPTTAPTRAPAQPTATKSAAQPTATKNIDLVYDMTLKVFNNCGEQHQVIFNGPTRLKYTVGAGQTVEYQAPQGTYTYTIDGYAGGGPQELNTSVWTLTLCYQ